MKIREVGEFGLIRSLARSLGSPLPEGVLGIGDDCAVLPGLTGTSPGAESERVQLVSTDLLMEGVHFLLDRIPPRDLGHKSLAVNLSDIAAMGGTARFALLSLALPGDLETAWLAEFYAGFGALAREHGVHLVGGDTASTPGPIAINVCILGEGPRSHLKLRASACADDRIYVTGTLGDSAAGLRALLDSPAGAALPFDPATDLAVLVDRHHRPRPHLEEGAWLGARPEVHAMMDVSDGIDSDLRRIIEASTDVGAEIELARLPLSAELTRVASARGWDAPELAAIGGEDYCLLLTVAAARAPEFEREFAARFGRPIASIGRITAEPGTLNYLRHGQPASLRSAGFRHF